MIDTTNVVCEELRLDNQICFPLYVCAKEIVRQYRKPLEELNLTYTQYLVMMVLWEHGGMTEGQLGKIVHLDSGTLTPVLRRLEKAGYINRIRPENNERMLFLSLTQEGTMLKESAKSVPAIIQECISLSEEELLLLRDMLHRVLAGMNQPKFAAASRSASKKRRASEDNGEHIPPFLIASITSKCNLHCAGCYSRCNHATVDSEPVRQLTSEEWLKIFDEADGLGISFILLAGGEPMLRRDIIEAAGKKQNILFPIFTNGTFMDEPYYKLFDKCRNLVPIMSIEGNKEITDARRGEGIYDKLISNMDELKKRGLIFGASVTVTTQNYREVCSDAFLGELSGRGCKAVIFVEYVPVTDESRELAPSETEREYLQREITRLRKERPEMVYISFPGDEKSSGGCVAAGRGFFHINSHGGAEPCPFSPYSDVNVKNTSLREALHSPLFKALQNGDILLDDHAGGCVLYEKRELVEALMV